MHIKYKTMRWLFEECDKKITVQALVLVLEFDKAFLRVEDRLPISSETFVNQIIKIGFSKINAD